MVEEVAEVDEVLKVLEAADVEDDVTAPNLYISSLFPAPQYSNLFDEQMKLQSA